MVWFCGLLGGGFAVLVFGGGFAVLVFGGGFCCIVLFFAVRLVLIVLVYLILFVLYTFKYACSGCLFIGYVVVLFGVWFIVFLQRLLFGVCLVVVYCVDGLV